jgi:hypothetical protein
MTRFPLQSADRFETPPIRLDTRHHRTRNQAPLTRCGVRAPLRASPRPQRPTAPHRLLPDAKPTHPQPDRSHQPKLRNRNQQRTQTSPPRTLRQKPLRLRRLQPHPTTTPTRQPNLHPPRLQHPTTHLRTHKPPLLQKPRHPHTTRHTPPPQPAPLIPGGKDSSGLPLARNDDRAP